MFAMYARMTHVGVRLFFVSLLFGATQSAAEDAAELAPIPIAEITRTQQVQFADEVLPILRKKCLACHNETDAEAGVVLETPEMMLDSDAEVLNLDDPESSPLLQLTARVEEPIMPPADNDAGADPLTSEELGLIRLWIRQGAPATEPQANAALDWRALPGRLQAIQAVAVDAAGRLAACGRANHLYVYDATDGALLDKPVDPSLADGYGVNAAHLDMVQSLAASPVGDLIASGGYRNVKLWRIALPPPRPFNGEFETSSSASASKYSGEPATRHPALVAERSRAVAEHERASLTGELENQDQRVAESAAALEAAKKSLSESKQKLSDAQTTVDEATAAEEESRQSDNESAQKAAAETLKKAQEALAAAQQARDVANAKLEDAKRDVTRETNSQERLQTQLAAAEKLVAARTDVLERAEQAVEESSDAAVIILGDEGQSILADVRASGAILLFSTMQPDAAPLAVNLPEEFTPVGSHAGELIVADEQNEKYAVALKPRWVLERTLGAVEGESPFADRVTALAFSPDGAYLAVGGGEPSRSGQIHLIDVATGEIVREFESPHSDVVAALAFRPDGELLASGGADRLLKVFRTDDGSLMYNLEGHTHHVLSVAWRADGGRLVSAGADKAVKVWNPRTGEQERTIGLFGKEATAAAFIGDEDLLAAASGDGVARRINAGDGAQQATFPKAAGFLLTGAADWNGELFAAGGQDGVLRLWRPREGELLHALAPMH